MWCNSTSCLVCPLVCPLHYPFALCMFHVMSFSQLSGLPPSLSCPLSSCLVQVPCDVTQPAVWFALLSDLSIIQLPCTSSMWCHSASCLVCPLVWPVHYPVALYKLHVMSYSQMSSFHPRLSSPLFSCIVLGACYVIHLVDLFPSSVQHCAPINVSLSQSTRLVVASCWTRKRIQFTWTLILHLNVHFCAWSASTKWWILSDR